MKRSIKILLFALSLVVLLPALKAQHDPKQMGLNAITLEAVQGQLEFLASDWTEGRGTSEKGEYLAADYIASIFKIYGLKPAGDAKMTRPSRAERMAGVRPQEYRTFFQEFGLIKYTSGKKQEFSVITTSGGSKQAVSFTYLTDFSVRTGDVGTELNAPIVFVGYGMENKEHNYNDFKDIDVKGKVILRLSGFPGHNDPESEAYEKFNAGGQGGYMMYFRRGGGGGRNATAEKYGAIGVIEVNLNSDISTMWSTNVPFRYNTPTYEGERPRASIYDFTMRLPGDTLRNTMNTVTITNRVANEIIKGTGVSFAEYEKNAMEKMKPASKVLTGKSVYLKTTVNSEMVTARNVVGVIEGNDPDNIIVIGGHYDHNGMYDGYIWNGADDNASGTVGVMTIAKAIMATGQTPEKTIVFAAWSGEEKGLLGSNYFVQNPYKENIIINLNYDMIARDSEQDTLGNQCSMTFTSAYPMLQDITEKHNDEFGIGLDIRFRGSERPRGGSDHAPFAAVDIPIFYFMAAMHPDYHQPSDEVSKVNWEKMRKIIQLGFLDIWEISQNGLIKKEEE